MRSPLHSLKHSFKTLPLSWRILLVVVLGLGIFFRFANLDQKFYWIDEVFTSLRISGYTPAEVGSDLFQQGLVTAQDLQKYQYPSSEKSTIDAIQSIAAQGTVHVPLYFVLTRIWVQLWGDSIAVIRSLSAVFSILSLPALYLLALELFATPMIAWIAVGLFAVSPFQVIYAQEARPYSLWTLLTVGTSWALLKALRSNRTAIWIAYAIGSVLSLYTFLYAIAVLLAQGIYAAVVEGRLTRSLRNYVLAALLSLLLFSPWLLILSANWQRVSDSVSWQTSSLQGGGFELIVSWGLHVARSFIDFEINSQFSARHLFPYLFAVLGSVVLVAYALRELIRQTDRRVWLFVVLLIVIPALLPILPDLILGGQRSSVSRYFVPSYVGVNLAVAFLLGSKLNSPLHSHQRIWQWLIVALWSIGVFSCVNSVSAEIWWNKAAGTYIPTVARYINQTSKPIVLSEGDWWLFSLSHALEPETALLIFDSRQGLPSLPADYSDVFLFNGYPEAIAGFQQQGDRLEPIPALGDAPLLEIMKE